jgi:hypothetical protein
VAAGERHGSAETLALLLSDPVRFEARVKTSGLTAETAETADTVVNLLGDLCVLCG